MVVNCGSARGLQFVVRYPFPTGPSSCYTTLMKPSQGKYLEIAEELRQEILSGKFESAARFPSGEALSRRFGASRPTVERAVRELKRSGLLQARAGSGVYLTPLARQATGVLGVIAPDYRRIDFFTDLCNGIIAAGQNAGYRVLCENGNPPDTSHRAEWALAAARRMAAEKTAGVFLEPVDLVPGATAATEAALKILAARDIPVILIDRDYLPQPSRSKYDLIGIGNVQAGYALAQHMIDAGAKSIWFITQPDFAATIRMRIQGVAQACLDNELKWTKSHVLCVKSHSEADIARALKKARGADAFVCRNDPLAARLLQQLSKAGKKVPDDVMVAGFDDAKIARLLNPPLTTIRQPVRLLAETAVESLLQRIRTPDLAPRQILLDAPLVVRASTRKASSRLSD